MLLFNECIINIFGEIDYSTCGGNFKNPNWWEEISQISFTKITTLDAINLSKNLKQFVLQKNYQYVVVSHLQA